MRSIFAGIIIATFITLSPAPADAGTTRGPRCTFSKAEKWGMLLWLFPPAGAIYTPFACKRDLFDSE